MKWVIIRRTVEGKENIVIEKNTLGEIQNIWKKYKKYAEKMGWFVYKTNPLDEFSDEFIEDITTGLIYSLEIR